MQKKPKRMIRVQILVDCPVSGQARFKHINFPISRKIPAGQLVDALASGFTMVMEAAMSPDTKRRSRID